MIDRVVHHADVLRLRNRGIDTLPSIRTQDTANQKPTNRGLVFERQIGLRFKLADQARAPPPELTSAAATHALPAPFWACSTEPFARLKSGGGVEGKGTAGTLVLVEYPHSSPGR
jgi:hypothetical protein